MWSAEHIGRVGIWSYHFAGPDPAQNADDAQMVEELGFRAVWVPANHVNAFRDMEVALRSTDRVVWATGILNIWVHAAPDTATWAATMRSIYPGRLLLGLGASHSEVVSRVSGSQKYQRPLSSLRMYVDELEAQVVPVPSGEIALAALGPKMLALAAERTAGAHPYLVTPEHTAEARALLGSGPLLTPEQKVILESDPEIARRLAREKLAQYLGFSNYLRSFERLGFSEEDFRDGGSDRLVDSMVVWGDEGAIMDRVRAHLDAGADHVALQVVTPLDGTSVDPYRRQSPIKQWTRLAAALPTDWR